MVLAAVLVMLGGLPNQAGPVVVVVVVQAPAIKPAALEAHKQHSAYPVAVVVPRAHPEVGLVVLEQTELQDMAPLVEVVVGQTPRELVALAVPVEALVAAVGVAVPEPQSEVLVAPEAKVTHS